MVERPGPSPSLPRPGHSASRGDYRSFGIFLNYRFLGLLVFLSERCLRRGCAREEDREESSPYWGSDAAQETKPDLIAFGSGWPA